ncbi:12280_t:CDS:2 [Funneliformis geosporum]|uniref:19828_t:CDS:1 n=1 Tax=Funneliformis geosporum TaxID=1117311 RepID=A0A9W4WTZ6_9GLOM|nr:12280_t:CDS:2 [Funneliformis geosporum]CAI2163444.1 19828_t:CDS:2 [Funneliformis geosporum]
MFLQTLLKFYSGFAEFSGIIVKILALLTLAELSSIDPDELCDNTVRTLQVPCTPFLNAHSQGFNTTYKMYRL